MREENIFDLEATIKVLCGEFEAIESVYLFGSRRFNSGSIRSDIDILLKTNSFIKPSKLRDFTIRNHTALDLFVMENGKAISVANESYIQANDNDDLIKILNAVLLYDRGFGISGELTKRKTIEIDNRVDYILTVFPNTNNLENLELNALKKYFKAANENGLPTKPYLGINTIEASDFISTIIKNIIEANKNVTNNGNAKSGWTKNLQNEYDFQNLFWITVKPWLPNLSREAIAIKYDDQEKRSDFTLFNNQLIIELKYIKDDSDKRETVKTLEGLRSFYIQHPNCRVLIFGILVDEKVDLDDKKWETDFSYTEHTPQVKTIIIRNK